MIVAISVCVFLLLKNSSGSIPITNVLVRHAALDSASKTNGHVRTTKCVNPRMMKRFPLGVGFFKNKYTPRVDFKNKNAGFCFFLKN